MRRILNFESCLRDEIKDFLELRKSQGHNVDREEYMLYTLDKHIKSVRWEGKNLSPEIINGWLLSLPEEMSINTKIVYISHYRQFAGFLSTLGYTAFIPERPMEDKSYMPYIFSEEEICIHCLRHSFAVHSFRQMHKSGKDMYDETPVLSAYMGHDSIYGTERYLHMAAENSTDIISIMENFNSSQGLFPEVDE